MKFFGDLTEDERDVLELEENLQRKDLTAIEKSRTIKKAADIAEKLEEEEQRKTSAITTGPKGKRKAASQRIGEDEKTVRNADKHVAAADRYPFLSGGGWNQWGVTSIDAIIIGKWCATPPEKRLCIEQVSVAH